MTIAGIIDASKGTVSREIRRNCDNRGHHRYRWQLAQSKYERRMKGDEMVCAETIYRWIWQEKRRGNGKEFARHKEIAKGLDAEFYFARPCYSWGRGTNENTNGLIRQYIPKGTDFSELTDHASHSAI